MSFLKLFGALRCTARLLVALALLSVALVFGGSGTAVAEDVAVFEPTSTSDDGPGSLRDVLNQAAAASDSHDSVVILESGATYSFGCWPLMLFIADHSVTIWGSNSTIVQKCDMPNLLVSSQGGSLHLVGVTVAVGTGAAGFSGGIHFTESPAPAELTLYASRVTGNTSEFDGGGIYSDVPVSIWYSTVAGNEAGGDGGGIAGTDDVEIRYSDIGYNAAGGFGGGMSVEGTSTVIRSDIKSNWAGDMGGGVYALPGVVSLDTSTVANNVSGTAGGGIFALEGVKASRSTVSGNVADTVGGVFGFVTSLLDSTVSGNVSISGVSAINTLELTTTYATIADNESLDHGASVRVVGGWSSSATVVASDSGDACDLDRMAGVSSHLSLADDATCGFDLSPTNPFLGPLTSNGGATQTHKPGAASPLIDAVPTPDLVCLGLIAFPSGPKEPYMFDQRGLSRPQGRGCDIGAVEQ